MMILTTRDDDDDDDDDNDNYFITTLSPEPHKLIFVFVLSQVHKTVF
jgi:hypothetical protein